MLRASGIAISAKASVSMPRQARYARVMTGFLGYMIGMLGEGGVYDAMFATVLTVALLGFVADRLFQMFSRRVLRWQQ